jgi:hypothetical protein
MPSQRSSDEKCFQGSSLNGCVAEWLRRRIHEPAIRKFGDTQMPLFPYFLFAVAVVVNVMAVSA